MFRSRDPHAHERTSGAQNGTRGTLSSGAFHVPTGVRPTATARVTVGQQQRTANDIGVEVRAGCRTVDRLDEESGDSAGDSGNEGLAARGRKSKRHDACVRPRQHSGRGAFSEHRSSSVPPPPRVRLRFIMCPMYVDGRAGTQQCPAGPRSFPPAPVATARHVL